MICCRGKRQKQGLLKEKKTKQNVLIHKIIMKFSNSNSNQAYWSASEKIEQNSSHVNHDLAFNVQNDSRMKLWKWKRIFTNHFLQDPPQAWMTKNVCRPPPPIGFSLS